MTTEQRPHRVLLIEDSEADAALLERFLMHDDQQYELTIARSGEDGLERCRTERPEVVLLDYDLPDLDGLEFLEELKQIARRDEFEAPVVLAVTGQSDPRIAAELIRRGALDYIAKSDANEETVRLAVRQAVRTRALRDDLERRTREREASRVELVASLERASFLASVSELLTRSLDVRAVIETVALLAIPHLGDACFVDVLEDGVPVRATVELAEPLADAVGAPVPRDPPQLHGTEGVGRALRSASSAVYGRAWLHAVARWDPAIAFLEARDAIGSLIVVPLLFDERPLGAISFASVRPHAPHARDVAEELARRASAALANARAFEAERAAVQASENARRRLNVVSRVSEVFARSLDWRQTMDALVELLVPALCDGATAVVVVDGVPQIVAARSADDGLRALTDRTLALHPPGTTGRFGIGATLGTGRSEFYGERDRMWTNLSGALPAFEPSDGSERLSAYMTVPLTSSNGSIAGGLMLAAADGRRFSLDDLAVAEDLGRRAGMYLENARLFERQREIAKTLQTSLLPAQLPATENVEFAAQCVAGAEGLDVGGDWYDVVALPRGRVAFAVGDVAGRGLLAAAAMGQLRSSLRAYIVEGLEPSDALARLNGFVLSQERMEFATVALGVLDTATGIVRLASAGHLPPLLIEADGRPRLLPVASSLPVGLIADAVYEQTEHRIAPGAVLTLYTDGLVESRTRGIDDGLAALLEQSASETGPPESLVAKLLGRLGTNAGDDVTVLALRLTEREDAGEGTDFPALGVTYAALPESAPAARHRLATFLESLALEPERIFDVQLAAGEAVANAVEHAYAGSAQKGIFSLRALVAAGQVVIEVLDHGVWRQRSAEAKAAMLSERGRGLTLMYALADEVRVEHDESGTRVRLAFALVTAPERAIA